MSHVKGILIGAEDISLLRQVRNSRFVTRRQLFKLLLQDWPYLNSDVYAWRLKRLIRADYVRLVQGCPHISSALYSITRLGLLELESHGDFCLSFNSKTRRMPNPFQVYHCLGLTDIRLSLMRGSVLVDWKSEVEVTSENLIHGTFQKDYDAVVTIRHGEEVHVFALEYECTLKAPRRYELIRVKLEGESALSSVLYLAATPRLARLLAVHLTPARKAIAICPVHSFHHHLLETPVMTSVPHQIVALDTFLTNASLRRGRPMAALQ